jgi:ubiquinone/menaquinone biosynthesis C-methylase UbiE
MRREAWRFPPERRAVLQDEERRKSLPPEQILAAAHVRSGETVIDLGAGTGFWTETLAELVGPEGTVFAVDVEPIMLDEVRDLVGRRRLNNVRVVQSRETAVPLAAGIADLAVLGFVLHELSEPVVFLDEVVRLLRPDGRVLVVDWQQRPTEHGPPLEYRISQQEAVALLGAAGLSVDEIDTPNEDVYVLLAREFRTGDPEIMVPTV